MHGFRTAHIEFWTKEHPRYPDTMLPGVPEVVRRLVTFGKGHHLANDTEGIRGGTVTPVA